MLVYPQDLQREKTIDYMVAEYERMYKLGTISQETLDRELAPLIEEKQQMIQRQDELNGVKTTIEGKIDFDKVIFNG